MNTRSPAWYKKWRGFGPEFPTSSMFYSLKDFQIGFENCTCSCVVVFLKKQIPSLNCSMMSESSYKDQINKIKQVRIL
jgi:hypothetical protein